MKKIILIALAFVIFPLTSHAADLIADGTYYLRSDSPDSFIVPLSGDHESSTTLDFADTTNDPIFQKIAGDFTLYDGSMPFGVIRVAGGVPHLMTIANAEKKYSTTYGISIRSDRDLGPVMLSVIFGGDDVGYQKYYYVFNFVRTSQVTTSLPIQNTAVVSSAPPVAPTVSTIVSNPALKDISLDQLIQLIRLLISLGIVKL